MEPQDKKIAEINPRREAAQEQRPDDEGGDEVHGGGGGLKEQPGGLLHALPDRRVLYEAQERLQQVARVHRHHDKD